MLELKPLDKNKSNHYLAFQWTGKNEKQLTNLFDSLKKKLSPKEELKKQLKDAEKKRQQKVAKKLNKIHDKKVKEKEHHEEVVMKKYKNHEHLNKKDSELVTELNGLKTTAHLMNDFHDFMSIGTGGIGYGGKFSISDNSGNANSSSDETQPFSKAEKQQHKFDELVKETKELYKSNLNIKYINKYMVSKYMIEHQYLYLYSRSNEFLVKPNEYIVCDARYFNDDRYFIDDNVPDLDNPLLHVYNEQDLTKHFTVIHYPKLPQTMYVIVEEDVESPDEDFNHIVRVVNSKLKAQVITDELNQKHDEDFDYYKAPSDHNNYDNQVFWD